MGSLSIQDITQIITSLTGVGTFGLLVWAAVRVGTVATKVDDLHEQTAQLVIHTNSLTDKLMEKTDSVAREEGKKEGMAEQIAIHAADLSSVAADAAAKVLAVAAAQAAETLKTATALALENVAVGTPPAPE
jgi:hypothetical protein